MPSFDMLSPNSQYCRIWMVVQQKEDPPMGWEEMMKKFGIIVGAVRQGIVSNLQKGAKSYLGVPLVEDDIYVFGLPFKTKEPGGLKINGRRVSEFRDQRRATPLYFHAAQLDNDEYIGVVTLFKSAFLTDDYLAPSYKFIEEWIDKESANAGIKMLEVKSWP